MLRWHLDRTLRGVRSSSGKLTSIHATWWHSDQFDQRLCDFVEALLISCASSKKALSIAIPFELNAMLTRRPADATKASGQRRDLLVVDDDERQGHGPID